MQNIRVKTAKENQGVVGWDRQGNTIVSVGSKVEGTIIEVIIAQGGEKLSQGRKAIKDQMLFVIQFDGVPTELVVPEIDVTYVDA